MEIFCLRVTKVTNKFRDPARWKPGAYLVVDARERDWGPQYACFEAVACPHEATFYPSRAAAEAAADPNGNGPGRWTGGVEFEVVCWRMERG